MAEIINIPNLGEARLPLNEYDKMRDRIRQLEEENKRLTKMLDHVCDKNKVRVRRQIIRQTELTFNPRACGVQEIIEDKMVNMEDIKAELAEQWNEKQKRWQQELDIAIADKECISKALEQCQRTKIELEQEVDRLKQRGWWARLWNR